MGVRFVERKFVTENSSDKNDGFTVFEYVYEKHSPVLRHLFLTKFSSSYKSADENSPSNRTLLITNLPPFVTEHHIKFLFDKCGTVVKCFFQKKPSEESDLDLFKNIQKVKNAHEDGDKDDDDVDIDDDDDEEEEDLNASKNVCQHFRKDEIDTYKCAYVVFSHKEAINKVHQFARGSERCYMKPTDEDFEKNPQLSKKDFYTGIRKWALDYNQAIQSTPAPKFLKRKTKEFLEYRKTQHEEKKAQIKALADMKPDEDGWVTVNRNLRRDRQALVSNQFRDQKIKNKYNKRAQKRKENEAEFEKSVDKEVLQTGTKKKKKRFNREMFDVEPMESTEPSQED